MAFEQNRLIRWFLRRLTVQEKLPNIRSSYVVQHLEAERAEIWERYESIRYAFGFGLKKIEEKTEAPLSGIQGIGKEHNEPVEASPPPAEDRQQERSLRMRWFKMTEALAECHFFSNPDPGDAEIDTESKMGIIHAAQLLAHAGEVQHEIVCDLRRSASLSIPDRRRDSNDEIRKEAESAYHFFDLSTRCIEALIDVERAKKGGPPGDRRRHFCGDPGSRGPLPGIGRSDQYRRRMLSYRYALLERLGRSMHQKSEEADPEILEYPPLSHETISPSQEPPDDEQILFALEGDAAQAALWLELLQGDASSRSFWVLNGDVWEDPFARIEEKLLLIPERHLPDPFDTRARIKQVVDRIVRQWGLAVEQDMSFLRPGSEVWIERGELAADLYHYAGSVRIRRLNDLMNTAFPGDADALPAYAPSTAVIELR